jgi:acetyl-CoA acyltransferase
MSDVYVVGAGMIKFGRYPDRTYFQLGAEAALMALDDAGVTIKDVGAVYASSTFNAASMLGQKILQQIGQTGVPCINVSNACASGATAVREAFVAIKSGLYDIVMAVGAEKNPTGMLGGAPVDGPPPEGLFGSVSMPALFAEAGMVHTNLSARQSSSSRRWP